MVNCQLIFGLTVLDGLNGRGIRLQTTPNNKETHLPLLPADSKHFTHKHTLSAYINSLPMTVQHTQNCTQFYQMSVSRDRLGVGGIVSSGETEV